MGLAQGRLAGQITIEYLTIVALILCESVAYIQRGMEDMAKLLQIDFAYHGAFGLQMARELHELATSIAKEPGLIWKIWTENEQRQEAGGIYLFYDEETARAYLDIHTARLNEFGIQEVNSKLFDVNEALSAITHGPV